MQAFWLGTSFLIPAAVLQPLFLSLSEILGRRSLLFSTLVFFWAGAIICAMASTPVSLLLGRTIQGVGGAGVYATSNSILTDATFSNEKNIWLTTVGAM